MKKYLYFNILLVGITLTFFQSCTHYLEEDVSSILSIENLESESDIVSALAPIYRVMAETYSLANEQRTATFGADDITTWWAGDKAPLRVFDGFDYGSGENSDINWLPQAWQGYWRTIYRANYVINALKHSSAPEEITLRAEGEARFLRALAYFHLVRTWGNMPVILDGESPTGNEARATVLENYKHIEADLLFAEQNLPMAGNVSQPGRASSAAAKALLADLYLTWAGWPVKDQTKYKLAADKAKEIIDLNYFKLLPIEDLWLLSGQNSRESIFSLQFSEIEDIRQNWAQTFNFHESQGWSHAYPELQFFHDFPEGPRKDITFGTEIPQRALQNGKIVTLNPPTVPWQQSQRKHPIYKKFTLSENLNVANRAVSYRAIEVYRYAEVLLIYAEAQSRIGMNPAAIEAYNQVVRRAKGIPYDQPDASVDVSNVNTDEIIAEKGWELAGEYKRWFDLIRTEKLEEITLRRDPKEQVPLKQQPTKANYIAPIPESDILTSDLKQNPEGFQIK